MVIINKYLYNLPTSGDFYNTLKNTIAPNFSFTQSDLYSAIAQVYLYLDGVPTLDENGVLGIEYFNDNNSSLKYQDSPNDIVKTITEDRYANGLITDFQKGDKDTPLVFPCKNGLAITQCLDIGIPTSTSYIAKTDKPIREIIKFEVLLTALKTNYIKTGDIDSSNLQNHIVIDATNYIYEKSQWILLKKVSSSDFIDTAHIAPCQKNTFYYQKGSDYIYIGNIDTTLATKYYTISRVLESAFRENTGLLRDINTTDRPVTYINDFLTINPITPFEVKFRITYKPLLDGRLKVESIANKFNGEIRLDQGSGNVDIKRIGSNLFGNINKIGNENHTIVTKFSDFASRVKKGTIWNDNGNLYFADTITTNIFKDFCVSQITFSKNFNKLSNYIKLNQNKRFNEIDASLTTKSEDIYNEYLYFSSNATENTENDNTHFTTTYIRIMLQKCFNNAIDTNSYDLDYATFTSYSITFGMNAKKQYVYLPLVKYGSGNALCFEMAYSSPIVANTKLSLTQNWFASNQYNENVLYTDDQGFADVVDINFYHLPTSQREDFASNLPQFYDEDSKTISPVITNSILVGSFDKLHYYKKPNEIFALNYELLFLPKPSEQFYFGEKFITKNPLIGEECLQDKPQLYISTTDKYSILDNKGVGTSVGKVTVILTSSNTSRTNINFTIDYTLINNIKSWALCDDEGNILIACNNEVTATNKINFYVFSKHSRL